MKWHGGKGSSRRASSDTSKYEDNWERIFGKCIRCKKAHKGKGVYIEKEGRVCEECLEVE
jgi:stalled ribosome alternative rescue factor ArfA